MFGHILSYYYITILYYYVDLYMQDDEGMIPCTDLAEYRQCVVDAMGGYENCTNQGLCSEGSAYYHAETSYSHSLG